MLAHDVETMVRDCLAKCTIAIHLLGQRYGVTPEDSSESVQALQVRLTADPACRRDLQRLIWIPGGESADERQRSFVLRVQEDSALHRPAEIIEGNLNLLKKDLIRRLAPPDPPERRAEPRKRPGSALENSPRGAPKLYLICDPTADLLAMASHEGNIHVWHAATGKPLQRLKGPANGVWTVAFSPDGPTLAAGSLDQSVRLWNVATWRQVLRLDPGVSLWPNWLAFSPDGTQLLAGGDPAILWSTRPDDDRQPDQTAKRLAALLDSKADFTSRIRMLSVTPDIWLRHSFEGPNARTVEMLFFRINCDDIAHVFLNGKPVMRQEEWTNRAFFIHKFDQQVRDLLIPGKNTLAVHCRNLGGAAYFDIGMYGTAESSLALNQRRLAATQIIDPWLKLATAHHLQGDQRALDQLVERRPQLAGPVGGLFTEGKGADKDWRRHSPSTARASGPKRPTPLCSRSGLALMRRSRIGRPPRPTGRAPRPGIQMRQNCSASSHDDWLPPARFRWPTVSLQGLNQFLNGRCLRTPKMSRWQRTLRNSSLPSTKMARPAGRSWSQPR